MSSARARQIRCTLLLLLVPLWTSLACWEQWSNEWFPQMKWQPAVQAFERTMHDGRVDPFLPPEGTVPVDADVMPDEPMDDATANALVNPQSATLESLENGRAQFEIFCAACHGPQGRGDGPVSMTGEIQGPFAAVWIIAGPGNMAPGRSDGHLHATIRYGRRRMPSYRRIPTADRWDIVNYLQHLNGRKGVQP